MSKYGGVKIFWYIDKIQYYAAIKNEYYMTQN